MPHRSDRHELGTLARCRLPGRAPVGDPADERRRLDQIIRRRGPTPESTPDDVVPRAGEPLEWLAAETGQGRMAAVVEQHGRSARTMSQCRHRLPAGPGRGPPRTGRSSRRTDRVRSAPPSAPPAHTRLPSRRCEGTSRAKEPARGHPLRKCPGGDQRQGDGRPGQGADMAVSCRRPSTERTRGASRRSGRSARRTSSASDSSEESSSSMSGFTSAVAGVRRARHRGCAQRRNRYSRKARRR